MAEPVKTGAPTSSRQQSSLHRVQARLRLVRPFPQQVGRFVRYTEAGQSKKLPRCQCANLFGQRWKGVATGDNERRLDK